MFINNLVNSNSISPRVGVFACIVEFLEIHGQMGSKLRNNKEVSGERYKVKK